jgi:hypothetical protein
MATSASRFWPLRTPPGDVVYRPLSADAVILAQAAPGVASDIAEAQLRRLEGGHYNL